MSALRGAGEVLEALGHALDHLADLLEREHHLVRRRVLLLGGQRDLARRPAPCRARASRSSSMAPAAARARSSTRAASLPPSSVATTVARIEPENSSSRLRTDSTDSCERCARRRTSSATTAKRRPCSPAAAGLDGGVERQDVGLLGDLGDQVEDAVDLLGARARACRRGRRWRAMRFCTSSTPRHRLLDRGRRRSRRSARRWAASSAWSAALPAIWRGGARQLLHGGGDLDHRGRLLRGARGQLRGGGVHRVAGRGRPRSSCSGSAAPARPASRRRGRDRARRRGPRTCSAERTRSPAPSCSKAAISLTSSLSQRSALSGSFLFQAAEERIDPGAVGGDAGHAERRNAKRGHSGPPAAASRRKPTAVSPTATSQPTRALSVWRLAQSGRPGPGMTGSATLAVTSGSATILSISFAKLRRRIGDSTLPSQAAAPLFPCSSRASPVLES